MINSGRIAAAGRSHELPLLRAHRLTDLKAHGLKDFRLKARRGERTISTGLLSPLTYVVGEQRRT